jgi:hypothetical protein
MFKATCALGCIASIDRRRRRRRRRRKGVCRASSASDDRARLTGAAGVRRRIDADNLPPCVRTTVARA